MVRQFVLQIVYTHGLIQSATADSIAIGDLPTGIPNANLANSSITVTAGTGLSGGGLVALGGSVTLSMPTVGTPSNYNNINTDAQGRVTSGSLIAYLTSNQTITLAGDVTGSGTTSITTMLASVIAAGGPTGSASMVPVITWDDKGRLIAVTTTAITSAAIGAVPNSRQIIAGTGLSGGGDLSADRTLSLDSPVAIALGGTNSTTALTNGNLIVSFGGKIVDSSISTGGTWNANSNRLTNVTDPVSAQDAVTLNYLNLQLSEIDNKAECLAATTAALPLSAYSNGSAGIGATLTGNVAAVLVLDGYTPAINDRLLIKNQANAAENGIYYLSQLGTVLIQWVLTRTLDFDQPIDGINGAMVYVLNGIINGNTLWNCTTSGSITFGTTSINWTKFLGSTYTADETTLYLSGTTFSLITPVIVSSGGTGRTSLPAHYLLIGAGTSPPTLLAPGTLGYPLLSQGTSADPAYTPLGLGGMTGAGKNFLCKRGRYI